MPTINNDPELTIYVYGVTYKRYTLNNLKDEIRKIAVELLDNITDPSHVNVYFPPDERGGNESIRESTVSIVLERVWLFWDHNIRWDAVNNKCRTVRSEFVEPLAILVHERVHDPAVECKKTEVTFPANTGRRSNYFTITG